MSKKNKSTVTDNENICFFCGRPEEAVHHLIFGVAQREKADQDGIFVPACNRCHNMGFIPQKIHDNPMAEKLSKMLGQAIWERNWLLKDAIHDKDGDEEAQALELRICKKEFMKRYGKSYL